MPIDDAATLHQTTRSFKYLTVGGADGAGGGAGVWQVMFGAVKVF